MSHLQSIKDKIVTGDGLVPLLEEWRQSTNKIVFTNGCFDILHQGHITYLSQAADMGDKLIIGLNSDRSVKAIKGPDRPVNDQNSRALLLASLQFVSAVIIFSEDTPENLITDVLPDILVKGGDWKPDQVAGSEVVKQNGGEVSIIPFVEGFSSTKIINKIKS